MNLFITKGFDVSRVYNKLQYMALYKQNNYNYELEKATTS